MHRGTPGLLLNIEFMIYHFSAGETDGFRCHVNSIKLLLMVFAHCCSHTPNQTDPAQ